MKSFRTELEDPVVEKDIIELEQKIKLFRDGNLDEEKFRSLRLARGVYGQRQPGVQMVRIKLPFGRMSTTQLRRIADIAEEYASGNLHATTRQDIQIHYVKLEDTPELWARLEQDNVTLREACGNTVRNITASATAGIDPDEPFDVSPYAHEMFKYFLRNPVCQEMGRKFKIAFSSSEKDTALTFIHDIGFIPKVKIVNGKEQRGFKVLIGGGLGAIPNHALVAYEFLPQDQIIPFSEALLRIFDRNGERLRRQKARFKFLLKELGLENIMAAVDEETAALKSKSYPIDPAVLPEIKAPSLNGFAKTEPIDQHKYDQWLKSNVFEQKQKGYYGVYVKLTNGDMSSAKARLFAEVVDRFAADDVRITVNQGYLLKFVHPDHLPRLFNALDQLGFAEPGFDSTADVTACPGTDSCNLGISNSTGVAKVLEDVVRKEYPELIFNNDIKIKISGCPNSCGQHGIASIGFHGSSMKNGKLVFPALQVVLGGGIGGDGEGYLSDKVTKIPSKRGPEALRMLLNDYDENHLDGEYYSQYYMRQGKNYFYQLLKPVTNVESLVDTDYIDWGSEERFAVQTAVGECAGVVIDLVSTLIFETEEKFEWATESLEQKHYADAIYHSYNVFVNGAKALLLEKEVKVNSQIGILNDFQEQYVEQGEFTYTKNFKDFVLRINQNEPTQEFAERYYQDARFFMDRIKSYREKSAKKEANEA